MEAVILGLQGGPRWNRGLLKRASVESINLEQRRNKSDEMWKDEQQGGANDHADQKGIDPAVNLAEWHLGDISDHKDIDGHRRNHDPDHHKNMEDDAKPYGIVAQLDDDGEKDRSGQNHKGEVIDERAADLINQQNENHDQERRIRELSDPIGSQDGDLRHHKKMPQDGGACNQHEDHTCGS